LYKLASKIELNGRKQLRRQKPANGEVLAPGVEEGGEEKKSPFKWLSTLSGVYWQFMLLPSVKYKKSMFSNISSNYVQYMYRLLC
jgi:hypothetical protein